MRGRLRRSAAAAPAAMTAAPASLLPAPRALLVLAALALPASCGPRDVQQPAALVGLWRGHVAWRDATTPVALQVEREGDSLAARFFAPALGVSALPPGRLSYDAPRVHFVVPDAEGTIAFDGWLRRGLVVGALSSAALAERNPSRLPQLALRREPVAAKKLPWPAAAGVDSAPPVPPEPERSLGAWLRSRSTLPARPARLP